MTTPLIGITTYRTTNESKNPILALGENYIQAVSQAGGLPVLVPLGLPKDQLGLLTHRLDGLLFSGGGDIDPEIYGAASTFEVKSVDLDRDRVEIQLVQDVVRNGLPFLGICRGLQVINVALDGTLYTDIHHDQPQALKHDFYPNWPRDYLAHSVQIAPASRLAAILGTINPQTNSLHHQGVCDLAPGLQASAWTKDGLVEAFELPDHPFGLAVQWHPEWLGAHLPMRDLFRAFIEAAAR
jgi:putative glutamine amidotransferase